MAIQVTPPIQLDPSMDRGHELAFINQNFNNIASVIGQNSFVIVQSGTASISAASAGTAQSVTVTHNLGYIPLCFAFATFNVSGFSVQLPYIDPGAPGGTGAVQSIIDIASISTTTIVFGTTAYAGGIGVGALTVKYYLLQQTAN